MALTISAVQHNLYGGAADADMNGRVVLSITFDNSYPTGGEALAVADVNTAIDAMSGAAGASTNSLASITDVACAPTEANGYIVTWLANKLKAFSAPTTEVTNATDLSAETCVVVVYGPKSA
jgi:hypothetical protein